MSWLVVAVALFGAGVASSLSPCVLPLVPGYLGVLADGASGSRRAVRVATFAASAVATFAMLGSLVGSAGPLGVSSSRLQHIAGAILLVLAAASESSRRGWLHLEWRPVRWLPRSPIPRAVAIGIGCGAAWSPCVGPLLGAALTAAGGAGSAWRGTLLVACFGFGVVSPLLLASALPTIPRGWRRIGRAAQLVAPVMLAAVGLSLLFGWYAWLIQRLPIVA